MIPGASENQPLQGPTGLLVRAWLTGNPAEQSVAAMPPQPAGVECITLVRLEGTVWRGALSCGCNRSVLAALADRVRRKEAGCDLLTGA